MMSKKQFFTFGAIGMAVVAIIVGFCLVFFGNKVIKEIPDVISIEQIDDEYYLVTNFKSEYGYQFRIEQMASDSYFVVGNFDSTTNALNISKLSQFDIVAGSTYRFSVCFTTESGSGNSEYSEFTVWQPSWSLKSVKYENMFLNEDGILFWDSVYMAVNYSISFVDKDGNVLTAVSNNNQYSLSNFSVGKYKVYIVANSGNDFIFSSNGGVGKEVVISCQNQIVDLVRNDNNSLKIVCTQIVEEFNIFVDGVLKGTLQVENFTQVDDLFEYQFSNAGILLNTIDFNNSVVQIKSASNGYVLESDSHAIS